MPNLIALVAGFAIGFVNAIPVGPVSAAIVESSCRNGFRYALAVGLGALLIDIFYCLVGVFGATMIQNSLQFVLEPAGGPVLLAFGAHLIFKRTDLESPRIPSNPSVLLTKNFITGMMLYLTNPLPIAFWIVTMSILYGNGIIQDSTEPKIVFVFGMAVGTGLWFFLLAKIISRFQSNMKAARLDKISLVCGIFLVLAGLYLLINYMINA